MTSTPSEDLLRTLIERTLRAGADAADARLGESASLSVEVRKGELESVEREESRGLALRALVGRRQAHVSATDLSASSLDALGDRVVAMARMAPEDPWVGIPDSSEISLVHPDLELDCDDTPEADVLEERARQGEEAALAVPGIKQTGHSGASWSTSRSWVAASNGFFASRSSGMSSMAVVAIAERDGAMERDHDSRSERRRDRMISPAAIGRLAGERAAARLGARKIGSQTAAVIFENRLANRLLGAFVGAISGPAVARGVSFLKDKMRRPVFAPGIQVIDDPLRRGGFGSRSFDGEGRAVGRTALVDNGVLTQWLLNGPSARQLGLTPNGFASMGFGDPPGVTTSNLEIPAGRRTLAELMSDAGRGLLVTDMFGPSLNSNTGDYSVGVSGFWFEGGERTFPVSEVTVAGDLPTMFLRAIPGSDLEIRGSTNAPSLLIDGLALAGV
ncbi:MAG: TldD/PmbA family protein [Alphaproteobacteria bacterium]|nr:TldD/PmbA family protein [Alphaproteobacteria bacterium]